LKSCHRRFGIWRGNYSFSILYNILYNMDWFGFMVFNATFNNISVISWRSVLLVDETRVRGENHVMFIKYISQWTGFELTKAPIAYVVINQMTVMAPMSGIPLQKFKYISWTTFISPRAPDNFYVDGGFSFTLYFPAVRVFKFS
jgi:hypothetical protein